MTGRQQLCIGYLGLLRGALLRAFDGASELHARALVDPNPDRRARELVEELMRDLRLLGTYSPKIMRDAPAPVSAPAPVPSRPAPTGLRLVGRVVDMPGIAQVFGLDASPSIPSPPDGPEAA
jgi:hypothetical protein